MMTFLWFNDGVTPHGRKRAQLDNHCPGLTLETVPQKRPWNKTQAIFLCTMRENGGLTTEKFDNKWVSTGIRVSVNRALPRGLSVLSKKASITIGANRFVNRERFSSVVSGVDVDLHQTLLDERATQEDARPSHGTVWTVALLHDHSES